MNQPTPTTATPTTESLIAELLAATPGGAAGHPAPERLLAYRAGELADGEEAAVQDHVVTCRACTAVLLDLDELEVAAGEPAAPASAGRDQATADHGTAATWRRLAPHLDSPTRHHQGRRAGRRPWQSPALAWAVAAVLAVAAVGLGVDRARLEQARSGGASRQAAAAQANVPLLYLDPTTRAEAAGEPLSLQAGPGSLVVIATPEAGVDYPEYRLILGDGTGQLVAVDGLVPTEYGTLRVALPRPAAGDYVLRLEGRGEGGWQAAGIYPLRVETRRAVTGPRRFGPRWLERRGFGPRAAILAGIPAVAAAAAALLWAAGPTGAPPPVPLLAPNASVRRSLAGGEEHVFRVPLPAGAAVEVEAEQQGVDLALRFVDPAGRHLLAVDGPTWRYGHERLLAVTGVAGEHRLVVSGLAGEPRGDYALRLRGGGSTAQRASPGFQRRAAAAAALATQAGESRLLLLREEAATRADPVLAAEA